MRHVGIGAKLDNRLFARHCQSALLETDLIPPSAAGAPVSPGIQKIHGWESSCRLPRLLTVICCSLADIVIGE